MKIFLLCLFFLVASVNVSAQKDHKAIEASIIGFFNGLSLINTDTLSYYCTTDFELLENGEVWNMDTLVKKVMPMKGSKVKRENTFRFITTKISGNMAWISYHNTADFSLAEKKRQARWLESAVLVKSKGKWRIQLLHSTEME